MIKRLKKMAALLLTAACVLTTANSVIAANTDSGVVTAGKSGEVKVEKILHIAEGTTVPDVKYVYNLEPCSLSSDVLTVSTPDAKASKSISFSKDDKIVDDKVTGEVAFDLSTEKIAYPSAGIFGFSITEDNSSAGSVSSDSLIKKYYVLVYVKNTDSGLAIYAVTVQPFGEDGKPGAKTGVALFEDTYADVDSEMTNLTVTKKVTGEYADYTKTFNYKISFSNPVTVDDQTIQMVVEGTHGNSKTGQLKLTKKKSSGSLEFVLGDGDKATFTDIAAGTKYSVTETAVEGYTASYKQVVGGTEKESVEGTSVPETIIYDMGANSVSYVNKYKDITVTGVVMNNAPFAVMIAMAVLAFVSFIVIGIKRRKR